MKKMIWYFLRTNNNSVQVSLFLQAEHFQVKFRNFCSICNWASRTLSRVPLFLKPLPTRERSVTSLNVNKPKSSRSDLSLQTFELHCLRNQGGRYDKRSTLCSPNLRKVAARLEKGGGQRVRQVQVGSKQAIVPGDFRNVKFTLQSFYFLCSN